MSDITNITKLWPVYELDQIDENLWSKTYRVQEADGHGQKKDSVVKSIPLSSDYLVEKILTHIAEMDYLKKHPNCVKIIDYAVENKPNSEGYILYIKMDAMESLQHIAKSGKISTWDLVKVGCEISDLLEECERCKISHGAITMDNIYRSKQDVFLLGDFGIERSLMDAHILRGKVQDDLRSLGNVLEQLSQSVQVDGGLKTIIRKACGKDSEPYVRAAQLKDALFAYLNYTQEMQISESPKEEKEKNTKSKNTINEKKSSRKGIDSKLIAGIAIVALIGVAAFAGKQMGFFDPSSSVSTGQKEENKYYKQGYELCYAEDESKRNMREAVSLFEKGAAENDAGCAWMLQRMYRHGQGVEPDKDKADEYEKKAYKIYSKEADDGDVNAMSWMGNYLKTGGLCAEADQKKAEEWDKKAFESWKKAAEEGDAKAMASLAMAYREGEGTEQDTGLAIKWYEKSIGAGNDDALESLASLYNYDKGKYRDEKKAFELYQQAEEKGSLSAANSMALYYDLNGILGESLKYYEKVAEQNYGYAQTHLGYQYSYGNTFYPKKAEQWRQRDFEITKIQAENGDPYAMATLAGIYEEGRGVEKDAGQAREWREKANKIYKAVYEQGDSDEYIANTTYMDELNDNEKKEFYDRVIEKNSSPSLLSKAALFYFETYGDVDKAEEIAAMIKDDKIKAMLYNNMGSDYSWGEGKIETDKSQAFVYYAKALECDDSDSYLLKKIGDVYHDGEVTPKNDEEAMKWYQRAIEAGDSFCADDVFDIYLESGKEDEAEKLAQQFLDEGNPKVYYTLGKKYLWKTSDQDKKKAEKYLEIAANEGYAESMNELVSLYVDLNDGQKAKSWYEKARAVGSTGCIEDYIDYLVKKAGDVDTAMNIATELLDDQNGEGLEQLAKMYETGDGLPKDQSTADELRQMIKEAGAKLKGDMY